MTSDIKLLKDYFNLTHDQKARDMAFSIHFILDEYVKSNELPDGAELKDDDTLQLLYDLDRTSGGKNYIKAYGEFLLKAYGDGTLDRKYGVIAEDVPSYVHMDYSSFTENGLMVHFSDDADSIWGDQAFINMPYDIAELAFTKIGSVTHRSDREGYVFAYPIGTRDSMLGHKYGSQAVVFYGDYITVQHYGDEEIQAITHSSEIHEIWGILESEEEYDMYSVFHPSKGEMLDTMSDSVHELLEKISRNPNILKV